MAKHVGLNYKRAKLLIRFTSYFQSKNVLEFGTSLGLGTAAIHLGNPSSKITTLEDEWLLDLLVERPWAPWGR